MNFVIVPFKNFVDAKSRLRKDISNDNAINLWAVSDNLIKGAALNAIQILEEFEKIG